MNWKTPITLSVLVVILIGAAYYGWQSVVAPPEDGVSTNNINTTPTETTKSPCKKVRKVREEKRINAKAVLVNVYNAGTVPGLATTTLANLAEKGFQAGVADDAPAGVTATNVTILAESRQSPAVRLIAKQFDGQVAYSDVDTDPDPGIDVVVGDQFESFDFEADSFLVLRERSVRMVCKGAGSTKPK